MINSRSASIVNNAASSVDNAIGLTGNISLLPNRSIQQDEFLTKFHLLNEKGKPTGVFDKRIVDYLATEYDLFILGKTPYFYEDGCFLPDKNGTKLKELIQNCIFPEFVRSTTINRVYDLFITTHRLQVHDDDLYQYKAYWIVFRNGMYDPIEDKIIPHDPKYRALSQIPHDYDPDARYTGEHVEQWLNSLARDSDDRDMLLQFCGYCFTRDTSQQKFLILKGPGGAGKSTLLKMIETAIGRNNISNIGLSELSQRFAAIGLMGKLLNSCGDLKITELRDVSMVKKILGEDTLRGEAKGKDAISFRNTAKLLFSTNDLPIVKNETTYAFYRRLLVLVVDKLTTPADPNLFEKLQSEMPYFIHLCMDALKQMYQNKKITESNRSKKAVKQMQMDSDPVESFLQESCEKAAHFRTTREQMMAAFTWYCGESGHKNPGKRAVYTALRDKGIDELNSNGQRYFLGVRPKAFQSLENIPA